MKTYTSPKEAIGRSISHNEIAVLLSTDPKESLSHIDNDENVSELDWATENDGSLDVWGKLLGRDFRIKIKEEFPDDGKLTPGKVYDQDKLRFLHWVNEDGEQGNAEGYNSFDYFERDGTYKGPDEYGVEPIFTLA